MTGSKGKTYRKYDKADTHSEKKRKKRSKASGSRPITGAQNANVKDGTKRNDGANRNQDGSNRNDHANCEPKNAGSKRSNKKYSSSVTATRPSNQKDVYQKDVSRRKPKQKEKSFRKRSASKTRPASGTSLVKRKLSKRTTKSPAQIMRRERRKKRRMAERYVHFIAVFSVAFLVAIAVLSIYLFGYLKAMLEYKELNKQFVTLKGSNIQAAPDQEVKGVPDLKVNFKGLSSINADVASWIYMPGVDISYPVVRGKDNDYYLQHTFEKNVSLSGAIFMDYQDSPDLVGFNTFIYGHNMRNGTMFGSLKKYLQDETLIQSAPYFYLYLKDGSVKKYRIFAYYQDDGNSDTYSRPSKEGEEAYLAMIRKKSFVRVTLTPEEEKQAALFHEYVTLSTCTGFTGSGRRFLVHGVCVDTE